MRDCTKWWGPDRHLLAYFMTRRRDEVYLMGSVPAAAWESEELRCPARARSSFAAFGNFHADIRRVVEAATEVTVWPIFDRERHDRWSGGRIVLLGDACHPVRPYMAAGGAMAVEDAAILSRCLARSATTTRRGLPLLRGDAHHSAWATLQRISIENSWMRGATETDWFFCYDACAGAAHSGRA